MFDQAPNHKVITVTACFVTLMVGGLVQTILEVKHKILQGIDKFDAIYKSRKGNIVSTKMSFLNMESFKQFQHLRKTILHGFAFNF